MAGKSRSPHDRLMRALLADAPQTCVPGDFVDERLDERLREHRPDALFRAELRVGRRSTIPACAAWVRP